MPRTFDFECDSCGYAFEVFDCAVGQERAPCPRCPKMPLSASRVFKTGAWTTPNVGIFQEHYSEELGARVRSRRQENQIAKDLGLVRKEDVVRKSPRSISPDVLERTLLSLLPSEVDKHREARERAEFEMRSGLQAPPPEE